MATTDDSRLEIIITIDGVDYYMDTDGSTSIPINYQISDINDISSRKASYSLSIDVPETPNNRFIFNSISDLSVDLTRFNPNWKAPVSVLSESFLVFKGNLQLKTVQMNLDKDEYRYSCTIYSENDDFFKNVGEFTVGGGPLVSNLDFSDLNHTYSLASITQSWEEDWESGYFYPMIDTTGILDKTYIDGTRNIVLTYPNGTTGSNSSRLQISDFQPATYIKTIWDKIFLAAGYTYNSNFLNTDVFKNLLMPFSEKELNQGKDFLSNQSFYAGALVDQIIPTTVTNITYHATPPARIGMNDYETVQTVPVDRNYQIGFYTYQQLKFADVNPPFSNPGGLWNTTTSLFTANSQVVQQSFKLMLDLEFTTWGAAAMAAQTALDPHSAYYRSLCIVVCRSRDNTIAGATVSGWSTTPTLAQLLSYPRIPFFGGKTFHSVVQNTPAAASSVPPGIYQLAQTVDGMGNTVNTSHLEIVTDRLDNRSPNVDAYYHSLRDGEQVQAFIVNYAAISTFLGNSTMFFNPTPQINWTDLTVSQGSSFQNLVSVQTIPGQPINYNQIMPSNMKQKDFLTSIIKMFNLYIEPSKEYPNTLNIEPRDDYYAAGEFDDWTKKLDITKPINQKILAETQNKSTLFTYRSDSDFYNTDYNSIFKRLYGDVRFKIDNDFTVGEKKIECIFAPTPLRLLPGSDVMVYPSIFKLNNGKLQKANGYNWRILFRSPQGTINLPSNESWDFETDLYEQIPPFRRLHDNVMRKYPYVGHFYPDPFTPTEDLNWGQSYLYYQNTPTPNNLFNRYWRKTMNEISDVNSRVVTAQFNLTPEDIYKFTFNKNIYLVIDGVGNYYKVNKISQYDPTQTQTTTVELLKTIDITVPLLQGTDQPIEQNIVIPSTHTTTSATGHITTTTHGTQISGVGIFNTGIFNVISGVNIFVNGNFNNTVAANSMLIGEFSVDNNLGFSAMIGQGNTSSNGIMKFMMGQDNYDYGLFSSFMVGSRNTNALNLNTRVFGDNNFIEGPSQSIISDINIFGNYNINNGNKTFVIGDRNTILDNTFVFGNQLNPSEDTFNIQATIVNGGNRVSAGRNQVLSPFSKIPVNYIKAGRNQVRGLGSSTSINRVSAGRNSIL